MGRYRNYLYEVKPTIDQERGHRYYPAQLDADIPKSNNDVYVITTFGDRLDLLAFQYYRDPMVWWYIAAANPELRKDSLFLPPGIQIRIPNPDFPDQVLSSFDKFNLNR